MDVAKAAPVSPSPCSPTAHAAGAVRPAEHVHRGTSAQPRAAPATTLKPTAAPRTARLAVSGRTGAATVCPRPAGAAPAVSFARPARSRRKHVFPNRGAAALVVRCRHATPTTAPLDVARATSVWSARPMRPAGPRAMLARHVARARPASSPVRAAASASRLRSAHRRAVARGDVARAISVCRASRTKLAARAVRPARTARQPGKCASPSIASRAARPRHVQAAARGASARWERSPPLAARVAPIA